MKVKTYRAATLKAALEQIKRELGPDAFILGQKEIRPSSLMGLIQKARVEVTAAVDHSNTRTTTPETESPVEREKKEGVTAAAERALPASEAVLDRVSISTPATRQEVTAQPAPESQALLEEVRKLKAMVQAITSDRQKTTICVKPRRFASPSGKQLYSRFVAQGLDENLACTLASPEDVSEESATSSLVSRISIYPDFLCNPAARTPEVVALLGPTGVGKTTTIAKLAALAAFRNKLKVGLITLDTFRIAAVEQLKTYGEIMGIPVRVVENVKELRTAIQSFSDRDIVLIDTAGRSHREGCQDWELAGFMAESPIIRKALVVSATTKPSDLADIVDRHEVFNPNFLIFTKLDETDTHGPILSEVVRSGLPLAYVTIGQGVPNDILQLDARQVVELAIGSERVATWNHLLQSTYSTPAMESPEAISATTRRLGY